MFIQSKQLHGFSDASLKAYGAVMYVRAINDNRVVTVRLIASKSRVAPLKKVSVPRLELAAAELLSRLYLLVSGAMDWADVQYFLWSDSTIALQWINKEICDLKVYVANRVTKIRANTNSKNWFHVRTADNPADLVSRGLSADELVNNSMWWNGPSWLSNSEKEWPKPLKLNEINSPEMLVELKCHNVYSNINQLEIHVPNLPKPIPLMDYTFNLNKLLRIMVYINRFVANLNKNKRSNRIEHEIRAKTRARTKAHKSKRNKETVLPTENEKMSALKSIIRNEQKIWFGKEYSFLKKQKTAKENNVINEHEKFPEHSKILNLHPVLDSDDVLRVDGRTSNSACSCDMKNPIIIPNGTKLCWLIMEEAHKSTKHGAVQIMMQYIRNKYWIPKLRSELRAFIHQCVICARYNKKFETQLMCELPKDRVNQNRAFMITGVDYAGPIEIKERYKSKSRKRKCWIAIFVCMVTRGIHIDIVTDLTSAVFIACFERFICRRGPCHKLSNDNGTTFVGAYKELKRAYQQWSVPEVIEYLNNKGTEWKFMKPAAPHQGGIYEAAVKSMKFHVRRIMGSKCYEHIYI